MRPRPSRWCRLLVRLLLALVAAPLLVVVTGFPASACSCAGQSLQESRDQADVVFAGEVLRRDTPGDPPSSVDKATYVVRVERVFKGQAFAQQEVVTAVDGASCGLELPGSGPALLFARTGAVELMGLEPAPGQLTATLCNGSRVGSQAPADFGDGYPPVPGIGAAAPVAGVRSAGVPAAIGLAGGLGMTVVVGLLVIRARRSRHG